MQDAQGLMERHPECIRELLNLNGFHSAALISVEMHHINGASGRDRKPSIYAIILDFRAEIVHFICTHGRA